VLSFLYPSFLHRCFDDLIVDLMNLFHQEDKTPPDKFADIWYAFINSLREDLISNRSRLVLNFSLFYILTCATP